MVPDHLVGALLFLASPPSDLEQPQPRHAGELVHRVAAEFAAAGWKLREVTTDDGSEFRAKRSRPRSPAWAPASG